MPPLGAIHAPSRCSPPAAVSTDGSGGEVFATSTPQHLLEWDPSYDYEAYAWLTGADVVLRPDGYWLYYTGFSKVDPPPSFVIPASNQWCQGAGATCQCYDEDGTEVCLLNSVVTLNLARRAR